MLGDSCVSKDTCLIQTKFPLMHPNQVSAHCRLLFMLSFGNTKMIRKRRQNLSTEYHKDTFNLSEYFHSSMPEWINLKLINNYGFRQVLTKMPKNLVTLLRDFDVRHSIISDKFAHIILSFQCMIVVQYNLTFSY